MSETKPLRDEVRPVLYNATETLAELLQGSRTHVVIAGAVAGLVSRWVTFAFGTGIGPG